MMVDIAGMNAAGSTPGEIAQALMAANPGLTASQAAQQVNDAIAYGGTAYNTLNINADTVNSAANAAGAGDVTLSGDMGDATVGLAPLSSDGYTAIDPSFFYDNNLTSFDAGDYLAANPDVAAAGANPYEHYRLFGMGEGRSLAPATAGTDTGSALSPIGDYYTNQADLARFASIDPSVYSSLDTAAYAAASPDLAAAGIDTPEELQAHYALMGRDNPDRVAAYNAAMQGGAGAGTGAGSSQTGGASMPTADDINIYEYALLNPDVVKSLGKFDEAGLRGHYTDYGMNEGRQYDIADIDVGKDLYDYARGFDADYYKRQRPDVVEAGVDPLTHYLQFGRAEGSFLNPKNAYLAGLTGFDPNYYLEQNPDVLAAIQSGSAISPLSHFANFGMKEQRLPYEGFEYPEYVDPYEQGKNAAAGNYGMGMPNYGMPNYGMGFGMPNYGMSFGMPNYGMSFGMPYMGYNPYSMGYGQQSYGSSMPSYAGNPYYMGSPYGGGAGSFGMMNYSGMNFGPSAGQFYF